MSLSFGGKGSPLESIRVIQEGNCRKINSTAVREKVVEDIQH